jgi:hypothetical protein
MGAVGWIIVGLVAASLVRLGAGDSAAGTGPKWFAAGVAGALAGGAIGSLAGLGSLSLFFSAGTWTVALAGALIALAIFQATTSGAFGVPEIRERDVRSHDR